MKKLKFLLLVLFCNVDLITCASLPNKKVKINPFEKLIENPDVFAHALSYLSFKDNLNVVLASKYFQKIVMNKVPLTVKLVDELTKDQLNFIKKWNFENLNVGYKIKDTINQESINLINQFLNDMPEELNYDIISESTLYIPSQKVTHNNEVKDVPELYIINRSDNAKMYLSVKDYNSVNEINQAILYLSLIHI